MAVQVAIFDLDGTLSDSIGAITSSVAQTLAEMGYPPLTQSQLRSFVGPPLLESFPKHTTMTETQAEEAVEVYRRYYSPKMQEIPLFPGIPEFLADLRKAEIRLAVVSAKLDYLVKESIEYAGIGEYFEILAGIDSDMDEKYLPAGINSCKTLVLGEVLTKMQQTKPFETAVMIGDRSNDYWAATDNQIPAIGVAWGAGEIAEFPHSEWVETLPELYRKLAG